MKKIIFIAVLLATTLFFKQGSADNGERVNLNLNHNDTKNMQFIVRN